MSESIQCYQCGTRMTLAELVKNQDDCPECGAQHSLNDAAKALDLNTRATHPAPESAGGVEVELLELLREMVDLHERRGTVLTVHMAQLRALLEVKP